MHPVRRRKKRPNYGVRTVEVSRGKNGFGFTISGQQPCILSCIVSGSPAERAGLRPGDYLMAVNGQSVSKLPHDDVVRLIGCLNGILKLQIAENYYSDSSDEEHAISIRSKPRFVHKPKSSNFRNPNLIQMNRLTKARDYRTAGALDKLTEGVLSNIQVLNDSWALPALPPPRVSNVHSLDTKEELSFVIGYLGTIEMPKEIQSGCKTQVVRSCIKRLRTEKRSHIWVLMKVHADGVTIAGNGGKILAEYPVNRITFCGPGSEEDKKYFGLVTIAIGDGNEVSPSSSCHVFAVQSNLFEHSKHSSQASAFKITCTSATLSQDCFEFPPTSEPILNAIRSFCLTKDEGNQFPNEMLQANSPQPSHSGSTVASSNSDSGIGFRDDCGNQSDRIVMVDIENQRLHIQQLFHNSRGVTNIPNSINIQLEPRNLETPSANLKHAFACANALCPLPVAIDPLCGACSLDQRLTVRALTGSKVPASNRSRSPLNSSSNDDDDDDDDDDGDDNDDDDDGDNDSEDDDDDCTGGGGGDADNANYVNNDISDKTLTRHSYLKSMYLRNADRKFSSKVFISEDSPKSLPVSGLFSEKSIFHQLDMQPDNEKLKRSQNLICKVTSKSSENLDHSSSNFYKSQLDSATTKVNSKSSDNLMQSNWNDFYSRNFKLSPQVNIGKLNMRQKIMSPLSISYGEDGVVHLNQEANAHSIGENFDKNSQVLLSYSMSPSLNFGKEFPAVESKSLKQNQFKSADDMSICSSRSTDPLLSYKLSPKVFGLKRPLTSQSLEDLKGSDIVTSSELSNEKTIKIQQWGSLQELRSFDQVNSEALLLQNNLSYNEKEFEGKDNDREAVVGWSSSFEKLLGDAAGLNAFAEFLKKEFSQENIIFWIACEKYKSIRDENERKKFAREIYETHLGMGATEPVNVDAHAHQYTQEKLSEASLDLFIPAQKQIFNLMKFDSYPRFIKSDLYKECLLRELANEGMPFNENLELPPSLEKNGESAPNRGKLKKSRSDAEDCRRKSLLPWHRKNRSKSKDRGEYEYKLSTLEQKRENEDVVSVRSEITSSRSSLSSWDLALRGSFSRQSITSGEVSERESCQLCRVILSDGATTVVQVKQKETIRELIHRLLEKRGLHYSSFELYVAGSPKPLLLDEEASTLSNKEVRVEQRIVFRLDLPNRRTISVKAKATKNLGQVLRSVLHKYSYSLEAVTICSMTENEVLELNLPVTAVDGRRLTVLTRSTEAWKNGSQNQTNIVTTKTFVKNPTLDEITNKVFEEVLQGKSEGLGKSDQGSVRSEDWGSEHSSGIFGKFLRRDSAFHEKTRTKSRGASKHVEGVVSLVTGKPPLIGKWKSGGKITGKSESDALYEGLKRAQRSRLEDQRGTEINFELPDFLKDKENAPQSGKKQRKFRREIGNVNPKLYDTEQPPEQQTENIQGPKNSPRIEKLNNAAKHESTTKQDSSIAYGKKLDYSGRTTSKLLTCKTYETPKTTPIKNSEPGVGIERKQTANDVKMTPGKNEPPPLPPKPKHIPPKLNFWSQQSYASRPPQEITNRAPTFVRPSDVKREARLVRNRRTVYLDQPSSSFV